MVGMEGMVLYLLSIFMVGMEGLASILAVYRAGLSLSVHRMID